MYIVDDPTLALITRFIGDARTLDVSDTEFLLRQIAAINQYVSGFPDHERQMRALEWIEVHASQYRQQWQKQAVMNALSKMRCADCPLTGGSRQSPCTIHKQWSRLLQKYADDHLSSHDYVEATLKLLDNHKRRLKVGRTRRQLRPTTTAPLNAAL